MGLRKGRIRILIALFWGLATLVAASSSGLGVETRSFLVPLFTENLGMEWQAAHDLHNTVRKAMHVVAYACFAGFLWIALPGRLRTPRAILGIVCVLAILDESVQALTPGRTARVSDVLLDVGSAGVVVLALAWIAKRQGPATVRGGGGRGEATEPS